MSKRINLMQRLLKPLKEALPFRQERTVFRFTAESKRVFRGLLPLMLLVCLLAGCGSKEESVAVDAYLVGEESAPAMQVEGDVQVSVSEPATYAYTGLEDAKTLVAEYVETMTSEENGFSVVDKQYLKMDAPDFTQEKGSVNIAKAASSEENKLLVLQMDWSSDICTVMASLQDAPEEQDEEEGMTHMDAVDLIQGLSPSVLELSGEDMSEYHVYIRNGLVKVNDQDCIWVEIYTDETAAGTNASEGTYYLSGDGKHLYLLNRSDQTVRELEMN